MPEAHYDSPWSVRNRPGKEHVARSDQEVNTRMADRQTTRLQRTLSRFDIVFLIVSAVVGLEMLGSVSAEGPQDVYKRQLARWSAAGWAW